MSVLRPRSRYSLRSSLPVVEHLTIARMLLHTDPLIRQMGRWRKDRPYVYMELLRLLGIPARAPRLALRAKESRG